MKMDRIDHNWIMTQWAEYGAPKSEWRIGGEYERSIVRPDGKPIRYDEPFGIRWFLVQFAKRWGWKPKMEGKNIIALTKDGASITLEPGGQFELSGAPHFDLDDLSKEFELNREQVKSLANEAKFIPITCGLTPIATIESIGWMPKGRYEIMREYLPQKGDLALFMMKGTTSVQCNYDFMDEEDCAKKVKLCASIAPLTTALFANSPLYRNRPTQFMSFRGHIWTRTDAARTGFPPGLRNDFSYERWIDYLLNVPMMFIKRDRWIPANGVSFREFINSGIEGHFPNAEDWELHMTSVFPEVRIKKTIEVRGADCVSHDLAVGFCALFTGLLYDDDALDKGLALAEEFSAYKDRDTRFHLACKEGLRATIGHQTMAKWAQSLCEIAKGGLLAWQPQNVDLLSPVSLQADKGISPAEELMAAWVKDPRPEALISHLAY